MGRRFDKEYLGQPPNQKEKKRMKKQIMILTAVAMAFVAMQASAATQATNTNTVSPTLVVNVTVQKAVSLTLATGTTCVINAGGSGDYNVSLGTVDALAINAAACGNKFAPTTPGVTNSAYYTDYVVTPVFTSQAVSTNTITAYVSSNFAKANLSIVQSNALPASIAALTAMSTNVAAQTNVATNATSGTALTRYVGVAVAPTNAAGLTGADSATITYTLTVL
jgi:type 1 fimbria pilin